MNNIDFVDIDENKLKLISEVAGVITKNINEGCCIERVSSGRKDPIEWLFAKRIGKNVVVRIYEIGE